MIKKRVLFVCIHNSARSQMAEAFLRKFAGEQYDVESAGLESGKLNPVAIQVMEGKTYNCVITVCDPKAAESCPIFPGITRRLHWSFPDPSAFQGTQEEKVIFTRKVREQIREAVLQFIKQPGGSF